MSIIKSLLENKKIVDANSTSPKKGIVGEGDRNKTLRMHKRGRLTIPATVFEKAGKAKYYSSFYQAEGNKLLIVFSIKKPIEVKSKVIFFYNGPDGKSESSTAYVELMPALRIAFGNKKYKLDDSYDVPYVWKSNNEYLELDLSILVKK